MQSVQWKNIYGDLLPDVGCGDAETGADPKLQDLPALGYISGGDRHRQTTDEDQDFTFTLQVEQDQFISLDLQVTAS